VRTIARTETPQPDKIDPLVIKYLSNPISPRFTAKPEEKEDAEEIDNKD
jgi:hypothetical protein